MKTREKQRMKAEVGDDVSKIELLLKWVEELCPYQQFEEHVLVEEGSNIPDTEQRISLKVFTEERSYTVSATDREGGEGYLGCVLNNRKPRAGESNFRGCDLPDGGFDKQTWDKIKSAIIAHELVPLAAKSTPAKDDESIPINAADAKEISV